MIERGEKKEEYRQIKPYYNFLENDTQPGVVFLVNGYSRDSPTIKCRIRSIRKGHPKPKWCDLPEDLCKTTLVYVIRIDNPVRVS